MVSNLFGCKDPMQDVAPVPESRLCNFARDGREVTGPGGMTLTASNSCTILSRSLKNSPSCNKDEKLAIQEKGHSRFKNDPAFDQWLWQRCGYVTSTAIISPGAVMESITG